MGKFQQSFCSSDVGAPTRGLTCGRGLADLQVGPCLLHKAQKLNHDTRAVSLQMYHKSVKADSREFGRTFQTDPSALLSRHVGTYIKADGARETSREASRLTDIVLHLSALLDISRNISNHYYISILPN